MDDEKYSEENQGRTEDDQARAQQVPGSRQQTATEIQSTFFFLITIDRFELSSHYISY